MDIRSIISGAGLLGLAACFGLWRWASADLDRANSALGQQKTITACEVEKTQAAADASERNAAQIAGMAATIEAQLKIINKSKVNERRAVARLNELQKDIANGSENIPVPDAIECVLDSLRGAVPGNCGTRLGGGDEGRNVQTPDAAGSEVRRTETGSAGETGDGQHP